MIEYLIMNFIDKFKICIDSINLNVINSLSTIVIAFFALIQYDISRKKRIDDLFKIRYKFYKEVIKFISAMSKEYLTLYMEGYSESYPFYNISWYYDLFEELLIQAELLFGQEIVDHLEKYLNLENLNNEFKKQIVQIQHDDFYIKKDFYEPFKKYLKIA